MSFEHFERGYLLPNGCKNLIDVIHLRRNLQASIFLKPALPLLTSLPAIKGDLSVSDHTTVRALAALLGQKPFKIIADAMELGIFANVNQPLGFEVVSQIARKYGFRAKRTA